MPTQLYCSQCGAAYPSTVSRCLRDGAPLFDREVMIWVGESLGPYHVKRVLEGGGNSAIYAAEHVALARDVAVKMLRSARALDPGSRQKVVEEARRIAAVDHPNVVDVTDTGETPSGLPYFVMERLDGEDLATLLSRERSLSLFRAVNIVRQAASALAACHRAGIVHRHLEPSNVFITQRESRRRIVQRVRGDGADERVVIRPEGTTDFVKLLDFGIAKAIHGAPGNETSAGVVLGDAHYAAPEHARGLPLDARSDVYALGVLFYRMVTGVLPFDGDTEDEILAGHLYGRVVPPGMRQTAIEIDRVTDLTILKCLQKDPDDRFASMDELEAALLDCYADEILLSEVERLGQRSGPLSAAGSLEMIKALAGDGPVRPGRLSAELAAMFVAEDERPATLADLEAAGRVTSRPMSLTAELAGLFRREREPRVSIVPLGKSSAGAGAVAPETLAPEVGGQDVGGAGSGRQDSGGPEPGGSELGGRQLGGPSGPSGGVGEPPEDEGDGWGWS